MFRFRTSRAICLAIAAVTLISSCKSVSSVPKKAIGLAGAVTSPLRNAVSGGGNTKRGRANYSYSVKGQHYHVISHESAACYSEKGTATWYGFEGGSRTASGESYNPWGMTAAHKTLPLGSRVKITNLTNGSSVVVRINDRGPFGKGRLIDCSKGAAQKLGFVSRGTVPVHVQCIN